MIEQDKRRAIYSLHEAGMSAREISRKLNIGRNTVNSIVAQKGDMPDPVRVDSIEVDADTLRCLYLDCGGFLQRIHEKLTEEEGITIGYSTLTRKVRQLGLGQPKNERCARVPDEAGSEMQHDTTIYKIKIGGQVAEYLNFALKPGGKEKHRFIRQLFVLSQKLTLSIFINTINRALKYGITDIKTIERIALLQIGESGYEMPCVQIDEELHNRAAYLEGQFCDEVDLFTYDKLLEEKKDG